jgi:hypothetical protein
LDIEQVIEHHNQLTRPIEEWIHADGNEQQDQWDFIEDQDL